MAKKCTKLIFHKYATLMPSLGNRQCCQYYVRVWEMPAGCAVVKFYKRIKRTSLKLIGLQWNHWHKTADHINHSVLAWKQMFIFRVRSWNIAATWTVTCYRLTCTGRTEAFLCSVSQLISLLLSAANREPRGFRTRPGCEHDWAPETPTTITFVILVWFGMCVVEQR